MAIKSVMSCNNNTRGTCNVSGKQAEALAARYLEQQGLKVVARNVHCRGGEIDLVCHDGKTLVFVEVRLRRNAGFGGAAASITRRKQQRVILAARHYLAAQACADSDCRFDCVLLDALDAGSIEWIRDAFAVD
jgi:putative endonuclease